MRDYNIYLAGGMSDISFEESNIWRGIAKEKLESCECGYHVKAINPNDYFNFLVKRHETEEEIRRFDINKVDISDLILVNLNGRSIGTAMELQHAFDRGLPIVGYKDDGEFLHPWLECVTSRVFASVEEAVNYIRDFYLN